MTRGADLLKRLEHLPLIGPVLLRILMRARHAGFGGSASYWETRYARGGTSGLGSFGAYARLKAEIVNGFVERHSVTSVIEFGCGDGNQLALMRYPSYTGLDVSSAAIARCREQFARDDAKRFFLYEPLTRHRDGVPYHADLALSLDVIYHLVEDEVFERYLAHLFAAAKKYVIIFSSDTDENPGYAGPHLKHRKFSRTVEQKLPGWRLLQVVKNTAVSADQSELAGAAADFYIYERNPDRPA
jgi:SAM-dependent methyltransferase